MLWLTSHNYQKYNRKPYNNIKYLSGVLKIVVWFAWSTYKCNFLCFISGQDVFSAGYSGALHGGLLCASSVVNHCVYPDLLLLQKKLKRQAVKKLDWKKKTKKCQRSTEMDISVFNLFHSHFNVFLKCKNSNTNSEGLSLLLSWVNTLICSAMLTACLLACFE